MGPPGRGCRLTNGRLTLGMGIGWRRVRLRVDSDEAIAGAVDAFAAVGVDEIILDPTVSDPEQVVLLARAVL